MIMANIGNRNEAAIIEDGRVYVFDRSGKCVAENVAGGISKYGSGCMQLPIISILVSANKAEMCFFDGQMQKRYKVFDDLEATMLLMQSEGLLRKFTRTGKTLNSEGKLTGFTQWLFVYPQGTNLVDKIGKVKCQEVAL